MEPIRLATPEEVAQIALKADLTPGALVVKCGEDWAVIRTVVEIDPLMCENRFKRHRMVEQLETHLRLLGVQTYYFNVDAADEQWQRVLKAWGAEPISPYPEIRFRKNL